MKLKTAIIIAGGKGTRLEEKTEEIPKPLTILKGKPLLERIILWLKNNDVKNIIIGVAYKKEMIQEYFGDGSKWGVNIIYTAHDENGGTGDAFRTAIEQSGIRDENFYAMNGDQITDLHLEGFTNHHLKTGAVATILTVKLRTSFGIVKIDDENKITKFQEKWTVPNILINSGIYVFNQKIKNYLDGRSIEEHTFRKLAEEGKIYSFYYDGEWLTINDKRELKRAEEYLNKFDSVMNQGVHADMEGVYSFYSGGLHSLHEKKDSEKERLSEEKLERIRKILKEG